MENVNKQLLGALNEAMRLIAEMSIAATGYEATEERIDKVIRIARDGSAVQRFRDMIAAAEQAQQGEAVAWIDRHGELFKELEDVLPTDTPLYAQPPAVAVPDGYVLVPAVATDRMTWVGQSMRYDREISIGAIYAAMLAAMEQPK